MNRTTQDRLDFVFAALVEAFPNISTLEASEQDGIKATAQSMIEADWLDDEVVSYLSKTERINPEVADAKRLARIARAEDCRRLQSTPLNKETVERLRAIWEGE